MKKIIVTYRAAVEMMVDDRFEGASDNFRDPVAYKLGNELWDEITKQLDKKIGNGSYDEIESISSEDGVPIFVAG